MRNSILRACFSARILCFVLFATLAAGPAAVSVHLLAQEPSSAPVAAAPAATTSATAAAAPKPEAPETEAEENNVYRHAPIVQTLAKLIHLKLETTARIFEAINFVIIALAIGIPLFRILPRVIHTRSLTLRHNIESARQVTEDANTRLSAVESRLSQLDQEIAAMRAQVEEESRQDEVRIKAALEQESARIVAAAEQEIGVAASQATRGLRHFAADLAIAQAAKQLALTPEIDSALIAEFVRETARNGAQDGGKN